MLSPPAIAKLSVEVFPSVVQAAVVQIVYMYKMFRTPFLSTSILGRKGKEVNVRQPQKKEEEGFKSLCAMKKLCLLHWVSAFSLARLRERYRLFLCPSLTKTF